MENGLILKYVESLWVKAFRLFHIFTKRAKIQKVSISFDLHEFEFFEDGKIDRVTVDRVMGDLSDREPSSKNGPSEENELSPIITAE